MPRPPDAKPELVCDYATTMPVERTVPQALHDRAVTLLGEAGVVELVGVVGHHTLVSTTLNGFDIGLPGGEAAELVA